MLEQRFQIRMKVTKFTRFIISNLSLSNLTSLLNSLSYLATISLYYCKTKFNFQITVFIQKITPPKSHVNPAIH